MKELKEAMQILDIDHLGIVAGIIDEMELVEEVNKIVGIKIKETLTPGQVIKAMILNGLGFLSAPLYLFGEFFVGKATEYLIGEGVLPEHLNDDKLGTISPDSNTSGRRASPINIFDKESLAFGTDQRFGNSKSMPFTTIPNSANAATQCCPKFPSPHTKNLSNISVELLTLI